MSHENTSQRRQSRSRAWDPALQLLLALALSLQILWLLIGNEDSPSSSAKQTMTRPIVAQLMSAQGRVQSRAPDSLIWDESTLPRPLPQGEWVLVGEDSSGSIAFGDGVGLELGADSLVIIERDSDDAQARIDASIPAEWHSGVQIELKRGRVQTRGSSARVRIARPNGAPIEGWLAPGSDLELRETGGKSTVSVKRGKLLVGDATVPARTLDAGSETQLEGLIARPSTAPEKLAPPPPPTRFYAPKIQRPRSQKRLPSLDAPKAGRLSVALDAWLAALDPIPSALAEPVRSPLPWLETVLAWEAVPGVAGYRVQIARDREFNPPLVESDSERPTFAWRLRADSPEAQGALFYRVASLDESGVAGAYSEPMAIDLSEALPRATPTPPKLDPVVRKRYLERPKPVAARSRYTLPAKPGVVLGGAGVGKLSQSSSATDLTRVDVGLPALQTRLQGEYFWGNAWAQLELGLTRLRPTDSTLAGAPNQPTRNAWTLQMRGLVPAAYLPGRSWLRWGAVATVAYRFQKQTAQSIVPALGVSVGPSVQWVRIRERSEWGVGLDVPITGAFMEQNYGARVALWWQRQPWTGPWLVRLELDGSQTWWSEPRGTRVSAYSLGLLIGARW